MNTASETFEKQLREMGLPREAGSFMLAAILRAGYDEHDESQQLMGLAALTAALRVHEAATRASVRPRAQVGRNDPCPCGSGRKFKKCCQGKGAEAAGKEPAGPPSPLDAPDLIPRMHLPESFGEDMDNLDRVFREDPALRRIRLHGADVLEFVSAEMGEEAEEETPAAEEPNDDEPDPFEALVARYLQTAEEEALDELEDALVAAASRWAQNSAELRALALGVTLAGMPGDDEASEQGPANPLHVLVFRRTLEDALKTQEVIEELIDRAGGFGALRDKLRAGEPLPLEGLSEPAAGLPDLMDSTRETVEEALWFLGEDIREGRLPVDLTFPSVLPCLARWALAAEDGDPSQEQVHAILTTSVEELGPEDARLLDEALEDWLETHSEDPDEETRDRVSLLRREIATGSLEPFGRDLLATSLIRGRVSSLAGEPERPEDPTTPKSGFTAEYLERYGDFLWEEGLPETARRTWRLCGLYGPLSQALQERLARRALFEGEGRWGPGALPAVSEARAPTSPTRGTGAGSGRPRSNAR